MDHRWPADVTIPAADLPLRERLRELADYARLAPSIRNSQPWRFVLGDDFVEVWAERSRALPIADAEGRGLTLSCGVALAFLEIGARAAGLQTAIDRLPDGAHSDLLGRLRITGTAAPATEDPWLFQAIPKRRTHRGVFSRHAVSPGLLQRLRQLAEATGAALTILGGPERDVLLELTRAADRQQRADPAFREELATCVRPQAAKLRLGIPAHRIEAAAIERGEITRLRRFAAPAKDDTADEARTAPIGDATMDAVDIDREGASGSATSPEGRGLAIDLMMDDLDELLSDEGADKLRIVRVTRARPGGAPTPQIPMSRPADRPSAAEPADDEELDRGAPVLAILSTPRDDPTSWLRAGETLARVLLRGRVDHLWASFFGQAIEVPSARAALRERLELREWPHVILRLGYAGDLRPTPRRPLVDQLTENRPSVENSSGD